MKKVRTALTSLIVGLVFSASLSASPVSLENDIVKTSNLFDPADILGGGNSNNGDKCKKGPGRC